MNANIQPNAIIHIQDFLFLFRPIFNMFFNRFFIILIWVSYVVIITTIK